MAPRIVNLAEWGRHVIERLTADAARDPRPGARALIDELAGYVPDRPVADRDYLGLAVPLRLRVAAGDGELALVTTLTHFGTAVDVTLAELRLEAFLPADDATAAHLAADLAATAGRA